MLLFQMETISVWLLVIIPSGTFLVTVIGFVTGYLREKRIETNKANSDYVQTLEKSLEHSKGEIRELQQELENHKTTSAMEMKSVKEDLKRCDDERARLLNQLLQALITNTQQSSPKGENAA